jgi:3-oxoacyl-[acyl-carrier protein] reductase
VAEMARTRAEIEKMGRRCLAYEADVALYGRAREVVDDGIRGCGRIDVLIRARRNPRASPSSARPSGTRPSISI